MNTTLKNEKAHIELALTNLRPFYPGKPDAVILKEILGSNPESEKKTPKKGTLNPKLLKTFAQSRKTFKTTQVMVHFQVNRRKVAGSLAALRRAGLLVGLGKGEGGDSIWAWNNSIER